jgi:hypothetical protein
MMKTSRMLILMLLVMVVMSMSIITPAYADAGDAAEDWAYYLWEYFGW